jgi:hypothetical protein
MTKMPEDKERLKQIWQKINEPKIEKLTILFENGKPRLVFALLDRMPKITRKRKKNKK